MQRILLVLAPVFLVAGCNMFASMPQSRFLSTFVLDESVKRTASKGIELKHSSGVRATLEGATIGSHGTDVNQSSSSSFLINEQGEGRFVESEFLEALSAQIKKEIEASQCKVIGGGSPASNEFYVEYIEGNTKGKITISGSVRDQYYTLKANVDEHSNP